MTNSKNLSTDAISVCICACANGEILTTLISLPLICGTSILPCFLSMCITLRKIGVTNSACNLPKADPILLERSAILSAISVAEAGVLFGSPSISLYKALLILLRISDRIISDILKSPAFCIGWSPDEPGAFGMTVPGNNCIVSVLTIPSSSS